MSTSQIKKIEGMLVTWLDYGHIKSLGMFWELDKIFGEDMEGKKTTV